ncbi:transaldolase [Moraxella caviae]|uniref:transaldolase n=1 Tax=Moraxella caviae TaxID=34060 RepID=A0A1S9ZZR8_9GAMM|nr:transaldolase [Moraxella caviae]OOR89004.1 transaldolase [Moraxella caviae]STZ14758.1 Transaldolase A [Moraxella caviae]VEW13987.1 Transaldolase A [Moraxella caviae]
MSALANLAKHTIIVADTGDLSAIARLNPVDATTNPSLITAAFKSGEHDALIGEVAGMDTDEAIDYLTVALGKKISELIAGRVSTEVDARLSFDTEGTIKKAHELIARYQQAGVDKSRILIKIAATWEGIQAAKTLEQEGIACNLTLLFTKAQAIACADANVTLISPFVGRITDFQKARDGVDSVAISDDMGVNSVKQIYQYYKDYGYSTQVMGASFRSTAQILALAGCDLLTIAPALLDELSNSELDVPRQLTPSQNIQAKPAPISEAQFRAAQENDPLDALVHKGIDGFIKARDELAQLLQNKV